MLEHWKDSCEKNIVTLCEMCRQLIQGMLFLCRKLSSCLAWPCLMMQKASLSEVGVSMMWIMIYLTVCSRDGFNFWESFLYMKRINCFIGVIPGADHTKWVLLHGTFSININSAQSASLWFCRGYVNETGSSLTHKLYCCNTVFPYWALKGVQHKGL